MRPSILCSIAAGALIPAALAFAGASPGAVRKCGLQTTGPPAWVLDGRVVEREEAEGAMVLGGRAVQAAEIDSVWVRCSRESHRVFGLEPGRDVVFVWTSDAPPARVKARIASIVRLQAAYRARHGTFAPALEKLSWRDPSRSITVRLCVSEDGARWNALGWQSSPADDLPRVLVMGESGSLAAGEAEPRYGCTVTPAPPT